MSFPALGCYVKVLQLHTDPLLVDVGQEEAVLLVEVIIQGVVPILCLHQAENTNSMQSVHLKLLNTALCGRRSRRGAKRPEPTVSESAQSTLHCSELYESCRRSWSSLLDTEAARTLLSNGKQNLNL